MQAFKYKTFMFIDTALEASITSLIGMHMLVEGVYLGKPAEASVSTNFILAKLSQLRCTVRI